MHRPGDIERQLSETGAEFIEAHRRAGEAIGEAAGPGISPRRKAGG